MTGEIDDKTKAWNSIAQALEVEPREYRVVTGVSGLEHQVQMLGVDEKSNRLVLISAESSSRMAALMQVDVQAAMPSMKVIVARPIFFDLGVMARMLFPSDESALVERDSINKSIEGFNQLPQEKKQEVLDEYTHGLISKAVMAFNNVNLPTVNQIVDIVQQLSYLDWGNIFRPDEEGRHLIDLAKLRHLDNLVIDRQNGICPIPLYEFSEGEWGILSGAHVDDIRALLKKLDVYQFFFPAPDQLALGLVERGINGDSNLLSTVESAPLIGHPFGDNEVVRGHVNIAQLLDDLGSLGYVAEGEHGVEITPTGMTLRSTVKYRPREVIFQKILNRLSLSLSVSPKDFMH